MADPKYIELFTNPAKVALGDIPVLDYPDFCDFIDLLMAEEGTHCLAYFVHPLPDAWWFITCMAADENHAILLLSHVQKKEKELQIPSLSAKHFQFHLFEREIHEKYGISFTNHPWLKPVRFPYDRADQGMGMDNYPFFSMDGDGLHEVGVGPIHAGVIEPGYFRFICHGEHVHHLEIHLGYQHRGVEELFITKPALLQQSVLAENIAGDTAVGHAMAFASIAESLGGTPPPARLNIERSVALELERMAVHIGDMAALCNDVAYQFGQVTCEALRTIVINTTQLWCGNRFGKGLIRPGGSNYPLTKEVSSLIVRNLEEVEERFNMITGRIFTLPSALGRLEGIGRVSAMQASLAGAVGMAARSSGMHRDIRWSHPFAAYHEVDADPVVLPQGDVYARAMLRKEEFGRSMGMIRQWLSVADYAAPLPTPDYSVSRAPDSLSIALVEGWRGEICHVAITGPQGNLVQYKVKDPSFHNWMALALAVRNQEISDFPLCNKSYNLSYCGYDL